MIPIIYKTNGYFTKANLHGCLFSLIILFMKSFSFIVCAILEVIFLTWLILDILSYHLATNLIFWVVVIIEICLGLLAYRYEQRFRAIKKYNRSNFWFLPLIVIGIGLPIMIYRLMPYWGLVDVANIVFFPSAILPELIRIIRQRRHQPDVKVDQIV
jgi:hypothetical protein